MFGLSSIARPTSAENRPRSTARAPPAGTADSFARRMSLDPIFSSSSFRSPAALSCLIDLREFEQTSSAKPSVW